MTASSTHEATRSVAAELAMGVASGVERARALSHLESCQECRAYVVELAEVVDELLLLAPEQEPSVGFESKTLGRLSTPKQPSRGRRILSLTVAACVAAVIAGGGAWLATGSDRQAAGLLRTALERADGRYLGVEVLRRPDGTRAGHVAVYLGRPSWIFAVIDKGSPVGTFDVTIIDSDGGRHPAGTLQVPADGRGAGLVLPAGLDRVAAVTLLPREGGEVLVGRLPSQG